MATKQARNNVETTAKAREYGQHLAQMLAVSSFSDEAKQAWAALVPDMTPEQLIKFDELLKADMKAQTSVELEDTVVAIKAAQQSHDLSQVALGAQIDQTLDSIEAELDSAEK